MMFDVPHLLVIKIDGRFELFEFGGHVDDDGIEVHLEFFGLFQICFDQGL